MIIERGLQPNCSELIIRIGGTDLEEIYQELDTIGIKRAILRNKLSYGAKEELGDWDDEVIPVKRPTIEPWEEINNELKAIIMEEQRNINHLEWQEEEANSHHQKLRDVGFNIGKDEFVITDGEYIPDDHGWSSIGICDGIDDVEGEFIVMAHQHGNTILFPALKKISEFYEMPVCAYDGGSSIYYELWLEDGCPDPRDWDSDEAEERLNGSDDEDPHPEELR